MTDITSSGLFASEDPSGQIGASNGVPSIGEIKADMVSFYNIASGKAKAADWGAGIGGATGFALGGPAGAQLGANIGRQVLPVVNKVAGPLVKGVEKGASGIVGGVKDAVGK